MAEQKLPKLLKFEVFELSAVKLDEF